MDNWKKIIVPPQATIEHALKVIEEGAVRIALIVDSTGRLSGTLSDGDVRRAIIARTPLSAPVCDAMNQHPRTARAGADRESVLRLMERNDVLVVPLIDGRGMLIGVHSLKELVEPTGSDTPVFLMAGGFGKRLRPLTDDTPKPMLKLGNRPILETTLESFVAAGFRRFFISVHYLPETIKNHFGNGERWGVRIDYVEEEQPLGTAGALSLLPPLAQDQPLIMMNGDVVTSVDFRALLSFHVNNAAALTMCVREYDIQVPYGVVQATGHRVEGIVEKPVQSFFVNAGIYVLSPHVISRVPWNTRIDMPALVQDVIAAGDEVTMFPVHEYWIDIGRFDDFNHAAGNPALLA
jgi:dTDP-glucose pyrophosphorylase